MLSRQEILAPLFRGHISDRTDRDKADTFVRRVVGANDQKELQALFKQGNETRDRKALLAKLLQDPVRLIMGAVTSAQQARRARVIGKAMSSAARSDVLHIMLGHFRNC